MITTDHIEIVLVDISWSSW